MIYLQSKVQNIVRFYQGMMLLCQGWGRCAICAYQSMVILMIGSFYISAFKRLFLTFNNYSFISRLKCVYSSWTLLEQAKGTKAKLSLKIKYNIPFQYFSTKICLQLGLTGCVYKSVGPIRLQSNQFSGFVGRLMIILN